MRKIIVTTTINKPTEALIKYSEMSDWELLVVGDQKTPHDPYKFDLKCHYLHPDDQARDLPKLSELLGWNTIQRRNLGFICAYHLGADIIATVDDDNIPYENWGQDLLVGTVTEVDCYESANGVFDPLSVTNHKELWHRGYPIQLLPTKNDVKYVGKKKRRVMVQADLWDGDPDVDALCRLSMFPHVKFNIDKPYGGMEISPFNSQNTFIDREALPFYFMFPFVGRMDDIWGAYMLQQYFPRSVIYNKASVYQDRNDHDVITDLQNELMGYRNTHTILKNLGDWSIHVTKQTWATWIEYTSCFHRSLGVR